jgi:hypothetical protein
VEPGVSRVGARLLPPYVTMVGMASGVKWWSRVSAALTGAVLTLLVPVHAWAASTGAADVVVEAARARRRSGFGFFGFAALCCLLVVGAIVLALVMMMRRRGRKRD